MLVLVMLSMLLTDDAIPTIMKHRKTTADVSSREQRQQIREKPKVTDIYLM